MKSAPIGVLMTASSLAITAPAQPAVAQAGTIALASHRAVYELKLSSTRGKRPMESVRGPHPL